MMQFNAPWGFMDGTWHLSRPATLHGLSFLKEMLNVLYFSNVHSVII